LNYSDDIKLHNRTTITTSNNTNITEDVNELKQNACEFKEKEKETDENDRNSVHYLN
jgi:hypothetical protein